MEGRISYSVNSECFESTGLQWVFFGRVVIDYRESSLIQDKIESPRKQFRSARTISILKSTFGLRKEVKKES